ncbi:hypothetical protein [Nonomuraea sp. NPDC001699]
MTAPAGPATAAPPSQACAIDVYPRGLSASAADGAGELKVVITAARHDVLCHGLTLLLPDGDDGPSLFGDAVATSTAGWTVERTGSTLRLTPAAGQLSLGPGDRQEIVLTGLTSPATTPGMRPLVTTAELSAPAPTGQAPESARPEPVTITHQLFFGGEQLIVNFHPSCGNVKRLDNVTLHWGGPADAVYTLQTGTADHGSPAPQELQPVFDGHGNWSCATKALSITTVFQLIAKKGGVTDTALTVVVVVDGDITAGNLSANGTVKLLQPPVKCLDMYAETQPHTVSYKKAPTDGLLTFAIGAGSQTAEMRIKITPAESVANPIVVLQAVPGSRNSTVLPISKGAVVAVTLSGAGATGYATWFAFGQGRLEQQQD